MNALEPLGIELKWSDENAAGFGLSSEPNVRFLIEKGVRFYQKGLYEII
ncbi:hypothetical protein HYO58_19260 [Vibrio parahaemolyticus]|nr:hypothetical protein [Vibrio parahaemolyticus]